MALRCEVHAGIRRGEQIVDKLCVADVTHNQLATTLGNAVEVCRVARVCELVQDGDVRVGSVLRDPVAEVGAYEPGPAGDDYVLQGSLLEVIH